jgi:phospholipase C
MRAHVALALAASALLACAAKRPAPTDAPSDAGTDGPVDNAPASWNRPVTPPSDQTAQAQRASCGYMSGALPAETQGASLPDGTTIPIDTIVVVMMENRSFDHYFQDLPSAGQPGADVAPTDTTNPGAYDAGPVPFVRGTQLCFADTDHSWPATHQQIDDGKMDGFAISNDAVHESPMVGPPGFLSGARAMTYYTPQDLPFMYWAAQNFAIGDRYFASVPGPTWPNRMYMYAASSFGLATNTFPPESTILFDYLTTRGVTWGVYASGTPGFSIFVDQLIKYRTHVHTPAELTADAAAGTLPQVVFIDPLFNDESYDSNDEHPPAIMQVGQNWLAGVLTTIMAGPAWPHTAMFLNYDEHGGLYDHVPPPKACPPDSLEPIEAGAPGGFDEYGVRVPFVAFSPYAKKGYVSHQVYDHTSVIRFIEARFRIPALTDRDANALAPWDMFDFDAPPNVTPPVVPPVPVSQATLQACATLFANVPASYSQ